VVTTRVAHTVESSAPRTEWQGAQAPDFTVTDLDGREIRLSDLRGKRVIVDFWATWCPPCIMEIPHFVRLAEESDTNDLVIIGISSEKKDLLADFVADNDVNYHIASAEIRDLPSPYKDIRAIPTTFFVDRNGVIQNVFQGYHDYDTIRDTALADDVTGPVHQEPGAEASTD
jgi:peroxiredoxin